MKGKAPIMLQALFIVMLLCVAPVRFHPHLVFCSCVGVHHGNSLILGNGLYPRPRHAPQSPSLLKAVVLQETVFYPRSRELRRSKTFRVRLLKDPGLDLWTG